MGAAPTSTGPAPKALTAADRARAGQARGMQLDAQLGLTPGGGGPAPYVRKELSDEEKALAAELEKSSPQFDVADTLLRSSSTGGFMRQRQQRGRRASFLGGAYDTSSVLGGR